MNKEITYRKIMKTTNRTHIQNVGKYLDIVENKWFSKIKLCNYKQKRKRLYRDNPGSIGN
jgi:hypothetical protein